MKFRYQKLPHQGYDPRESLIARPYIPVYLHAKQQSTESPYYALLDSGADRVLLPAELAREVGIDDIKKGKGPEFAVGIAGQRVAVYYFDLALQVVGDVRKLPTSVGFSDLIFIPILGRSFFSHFKTVIFSERNGEVELRF